MGILTEEQRKDIVRYRMENAQNTLEEVKSHARMAIIIRPSTECIMPVTMRQVLC